MHGGAVVPNQQPSIWRQAASVSHGRALVALCMYGLVNGGTSTQGRSLTSMEHLEAIRSWKANMCEQNVTVDIFLYVEMYTRPAKVASYLQSYQTDYDAHIRDEKSAVPASNLTDALRLLQPIRTGFHNQPPLCVSRPQLCNCTGAWPRWLEQRIKLKKSVGLMLAHEKLSGHRYRWIATTRADMDFMRVPPQHLAAALQAGHDQQGVWVAYCNGPPYYGQLDWFAFTQHDAALEWARVVNAPYSWLRCVGAAVPGTFLMMPTGQPVPKMSNERLLAEWALARGLHINVLTNVFLSSSSWRLAPPGNETKECNTLSNFSKHNKMHGGAVVRNQQPSFWQSFWQSFVG